MSQWILRAGQLVDATGEQPDSELVINGTQIAAVQPIGKTSGTIIDATDAIIMPGFIDVHTHGGGGFNLHTTNEHEIHEYAQWAPTTGTTSFLVGVVGVPHELPEAQLRTAVGAIKAGGVGAEALGIHLEGPYMHPQRRGAHAPAWLRTPNEAETERILELTQNYLRLITLAPELPGAEAMIRRLVMAGVNVSIGHTDASYEQAHAAITLGIRHVTHCFNAMPPLHHREPGVLGALLEADEVSGELIGDGVHVHPAVLRGMIKALGPERTVIITDALSAAGIPGATFTFAGQQARVIDGVARLKDGTITGSVLTMDQALRNILRFTDLPLPQVVGMLTQNPARAADVAERKGLLQPGYDADVLIFDAELQLQATLCRGDLAFATEAWRTRLQH
jgi:N-acetylglucosamine-6-phosphate deacetylase